MSEDRSLEELVEEGLITLDEADLPTKITSKHFSEAEVVAMLLPFVVADVTISNRELARRTGLNPRTITKYRSGQMFLTQLAEYTNRQMCEVRSLAVTELQKILSDPDINPNTKIKAIATALQHSEKMFELMILAKKDVPVVKVEDILKELENF